MDFSISEIHPIQDGDLISYLELYKSPGELFILVHIKFDVARTDGSEQVMQAFSDALLSFLIGKTGDGQHQESMIKIFEMDKNTYFPTKTQASGGYIP